MESISCSIFVHITCEKPMRRRRRRPSSIAKHSGATDVSNGDRNEPSESRDGQRSNASSSGQMARQLLRNAIARLLQPQRRQSVWSRLAWLLLALALQGVFGAATTWRVNLNNLVSGHAAHGCENLQKL
jgi:hypothetical protein